MCEGKVQKNKKSKWCPKPVYVTKYYSLETLIQENKCLDNDIADLVTEDVVKDVNEIIAAQVENTFGTNKLRVGDLIMDKSLSPSEREDGCVLLLKCHLGDEFVFLESLTFPEIYLKDGEINVTLVDSTKKYIIGKRLNDGNVGFSRLEFQKPHDRIFCLRLTSSRGILIKVPVKFWFITAQGDTNACNNRSTNIY